MGREVRRVPPTWEHPRDGDGRLIPLYGRFFARDVAHWDEADAKWRMGFEQDLSKYPEIVWQPKGPNCPATYAEWAGRRPVEDDYMPDWSIEQRTHYQMYENTSEGTPISPIFATPEELARWLADTNASAFADTGATYEEWLKMIKHGSAVTMVMEDCSDGILLIQSGVAAGM